MVEDDDLRSQQEWWDRLQSELQAEGLGVQFDGEPCILAPSEEIVRFEEQPLFQITDTEPAREWFHTEVGDWPAQPWLPTDFDEWCLRSMGIDPL